MGASVSINSTLPPALSEEEVKSICGEVYNPKWFQALQDEFHKVATTDLTSLVNSKMEREVLELFFAYCPSGRMKNSAFYAMCRECKLLSKLDLSIQKAEKAYLGNVAQHENDGIHTISYRTFRYHLLADIAPVKSWKIEKLLKRLAECDALIEEKNILRKARFNMRVSSNVEESLEEVTAKDCLEGVENSLNLGSMFGASQQNAVIKIQSISRQKSSQIEAKRLKEIKRAESGDDPITVKKEDYPDEGDESEILVKTFFFKHVGPSGEMNKKQFVDFIRDGMAIDTDLTTIDCQFIFRKAKATASAPSTDKENAFTDCVVHQKRLTYPAIRILALSQAALFKGLPTSKFIQALAAGLKHPKTTTTKTPAESINDLKNSPPLVMEK